MVKSIVSTVDINLFLKIFILLNIHSPLANVTGIVFAKMNAGKYQRRIYQDDRPTLESATFYLLSEEQDDKFSIYKFSTISFLTRTIFHVVLQNSRKVSELFKSMDW